MSIFLKFVNIQTYLKQNGFKETESDINKIILNCISEYKNSELSYVLKYIRKSEISVDINKKDDNGSYPLLKSVEKDNLESVNMLINHASKSNVILNINEKDHNGNDPIIQCVNSRNYQIIKVLIDYASTNNIVLNINEKNYTGNYLLLNSIINGNTSIFRLLMDYANKKNIILNIKDKNNYEYYPLLKSIENKNTVIAKLIIEYADKNGITLNVNEKGLNGSYPLLKSIENKNTEVVKLIIDHANKNGIMLNVNEKDLNGSYPLLKSIENKNTEVVKLIIDHANKNGIILNFNDKDINGNFPLLKSINNRNTEIVKLLIDHANKNNIILNIHEKDHDGNDPLLKSVRNDDIEIVKLLIDHANKNNIILNINEKDHDGNDPLLNSVRNNNIEIVKLLLDYANEKGVILDLNNKNKSEEYPLLCGIIRNNYEMTKLLIDYGNKNNIHLNLKYEDIEYLITKNHKGCVNNITKINKEIFDLLSENVSYYNEIQNKFKCDLKTHTENYANTITSYELLQEKNYEWTIDNWSSFVKYCNSKDSPIFEVGNTTWKIKLFYDGNNDIYIYLLLDNSNSNNSNQDQDTYCVYTLYLREYCEYSFDKIKKIRNFEYLFPKSKVYEDDTFIKAREIGDIKYDKLVIGAQLRVYKYDEEQLKTEFINDLTLYTDHITSMITTNKLLYEKNLEWTIKRWDNIKNDRVYTTPSFVVGNTSWNIKLYPKGSNNSSNNNCVSLYLVNESVQNDPLKHIYCIYTLYLRNKVDPFNKMIKKNDYEKTFSKNNNSWGSGEFIGINDLNNSVKYDSLIIGINLCIYRYEKYQLIEKAESIMKEKNPSLESINSIHNEYYEWDIEDWEKILENTDNDNDNQLHYSPEFTIGDVQWNIGLCTNNNDDDYISLYLNNLSILKTGNYKDHSIDANYVFFIRNKDGYKIYFEGYSCIYQFYPDDNHFDLLKFCKKDYLINNKFIENNQVTIGVYICIYNKKRFYNLVDRLKLALGEDINIDDDDNAFNNNNTNNNDNDDNNYNNKNNNNDDEDDDEDDDYDINNNTNNNNTRNISNDKYFEYEINNWQEKTSNNNSIVISSNFKNYNWECILYPKYGSEKNMDYLSFYLKCKDFENDASSSDGKKNRKVYAKYVLYLRNYKTDRKIKIKPMSSLVCFDQYNYKHGFVYFINKSEVNDILEDDKVTIGAYIIIYNEAQIHEMEQKDKSKKERIEKAKEKFLSLLTKTKKSNEANETQKETLVIATKNYVADEYYELDIRKDEFLIVTDWNYEKEGWVYGHRKDHPDDEGIFPKPFIKPYDKRGFDLDDNENIINGTVNITPEYKFEFESKVTQLRSMNEMKISTSEKSFTINRNELLGDAYTCIMKNNPRELKNTIKIKYNGEEGIDAGGLLRDFFYNLGKEIGNPDYLLFQYVNDHSYDLIINKQGSQIQSNYLEYYKFVGRILGLTILHKQSLPISFSLLFYKKLLDIPLKLSDIKFVDEELYKNLNWLKENNGSENLFLSFELEETDCFGKHNIINLKPNGKNINVNDSNKDEYIELVMRKKLSSGDEEEQMMAVKEGFYEIIPKEIQNIMNEVDLSLLISGISEIDIQDWKNNTNYIGYNEDDITIVNFWRCVNDFSDEKRKQLLLFVTGNSKLPVTGFKDLQGSNGKKEHFTIRKLGKINDLPKSHTCCNYLSIPPYTSYTKLKQKLLYSITEGIDSFQIG